MGKGSKQQPMQATTSNVNQSNLPEYARPYYEDLMSRTQQESINPYQAYSGQRLADQNADTTQAYANIRGMDPNAGMAQAQGYVTGAGDFGQRLADSYKGISAPQEWGADVMQKYMSPYQQGVTDIAKREAVRDDNINRISRNTAAQKAGAFGGSRQGVVEGMAQQGLGNRLSDLQTTGLQSAYTNAQTQFGQDRSAKMAAEIENARNSLQGGQMMTEAGRMTGVLAGQQQQQQMQHSQALQQIGAQQEARQQAGLDVGYTDFVNQRDYPRQQLNFYSGILRGMPVSASQESTTYQQAPNPMNQLLGLGVSAAGAYYGMR